MTPIWIDIFNFDNFGTAHKPTAYVSPVKRSTK